MVKPKTTRAPNWNRVAELEHATDIPQSEHIKIVNALRRRITGLEKSRDVAIHTHSAMMENLNKAIRLLDKHNLLGEYYK